MSISEEHIQQITGWNQTATDFPRTQTVHDLFEAQVAATPDAIALEFDDELLSYRELNQRANCLAHYLVKRGVGREVRVGLMMERSLDLVVALLGILKAGGAYVPLDLDYPLSRIAFMLQDANAPVLLSLSRLSAQLSEFAGERVCLDRERAQIEQESAENPENTCTAENLAYVIYTSGSTGTPKGVEIQHRAINRLVCSTDYYQVGPTDRIIHSSSVSFDAATFELWGALLNGARLVGIDKNRFLSSQSLAAFLQAKAITAMFVIREDESADKQLVAYLVPTLEWLEQNVGTGEKALPSLLTEEHLYQELIPGLRQQLRQQLPAYIVPSTFVLLEVLPVSPNGKVDRAALPKPGDAGASLETEYVEPGSALERQLSGIWVEILKIERVGIHDNFFDLGGHSLMATQVVSRILNDLRVELPVSELFVYPTVAELAHRIKSGQGIATGADEQIKRTDAAMDPVDLDALSDQQVAELLSELSATEATSYEKT